MYITVDLILVDNLGVVKPESRCALKSSMSKEMEKNLFYLK